MPTNKRATPLASLNDLEQVTDPADIPGVMPPPGVDATVETKVRYNTRVDPEATERQPANHFERSELERLAAEESERLTPADPVEAFLQEWTNFSGYFMNVVRLPDPSSRLMPGRMYNRPCREIERLGQTTFEPQSFIESLQAINGQSGGVFRVQLVDPETADFIPDARLDRIIVGDPAYIHNPATPQPQRIEREYREPVKPPEPSKMDKLAERFMELQMQTMIDRIITPPPPPASPESQLSDDQRLALALLNRTDVVTETLNKIAAVAQNNPAEKEESWKERGINAVIEIAKNDPQIAAHISNTANAIVSNVLNYLQSRKAAAPPIQYMVLDPQTGRYVQVQQPPPAPPPQYQQAPPPYQQPHQYAEPVAVDNDEEEGDPDTMTIIDQVITVLNGDDPITPEHPIFRELVKKFPVKSRMAFQLIAGSEFEAVVEYISSQNPLYASLLNGHSGPHLRERLRELQTVIITSAQRGTVNNASN